MSARTVAIANQKGGVGKTTTAINLAHGLARAGRRVLLVDLDSQGSASLALGETPAPATTRLLLAGERLADLVLPTRDRLDLLRSNDQLADVRDWLAVRSTRDTRAAHTALRDALAGDVDAYDYALVDCGPGLDTLTVNALMFASEVLLPVSVDFLSAAGSKQHLDTLDGIRDLGGRAHLRYVVPTFFDVRTNRAKEILAILQRIFGALVTDPIRQNTRLAEAPHHGQTIYEHDPTSYGAQDYTALTQRVLDDE